MLGSFSFPWAATVTDMITESEYSLFTGSDAPENFESLRALVVARLEVALNRQLPAGERTEVLLAYRDGLVYPAATPIIDALERDFTPTTIRVGGAGTHVVTYVGGYSFRGEPGPTPVPVPLAEAIAWGIHTVANPNTAALPTGVQSLNIAGEYVISREVGSSWGADGQPLPKWAGVIADLGGRCASLAAPYRRVA